MTDNRKLTTTTRYLHSVEDEDSPVRRIKMGAKLPKKTAPEGSQKGSQE